MITNYSLSTILFFSLGGLGLFLYGIHIMSGALQDLAQEKMQYFLSKATAHVWSSLLLGVLITAVVQSSSAITAIVIALITAKTLNLKNGVVILIGANIGTTVTSMIISLNIMQACYFFIATGAILILVIKNEKKQQIGTVILGLGLIFLGLNIMKEGLAHLLTRPFVHEMLYSISSHSLLGFIFGTLLTALIQSSSATIGIIQNIYSLNSISLASAIAFVLGANIGTTITGVLAAFSGSKEAKQAAQANFIFNLLGALLFMLLLKPFTALIHRWSLYYHFNPAATIAFAHFLFNVFSTILFLLWLNPIINFIRKEKTTQKAPKILKS